MKNFIQIIKYDYLQRTRSYSFLITLCLTLGVAYTFVPAPDANYATLRVANYQGAYNSYWIAYVTAVMTSVFLSLVGFYLINSVIKKDVDTKVGQIIAASQISNFKYLLSKVFSNFLLLLSIVLVVLLMSILLFFKYNTGFDFLLIPFLKPLFFITLPALFVISFLAVAFEMLFKNHTVLQHVAFFMLFSLLMANTQSKTDFSFDVIGTQIVTRQMENEVKTLLKSDTINHMTIGYSSYKKADSLRYTFNGVSFTSNFIISRLILVLGSVLLLRLFAPFFHRFNLKKNTKKIKKKTAIITKTTSLSKELNANNLIATNTNYNIIPLIKTELLLLFRNGKKGLWILNLTAMLLLVIVPTAAALQIVLPILWFMQVSRLSSLTTKENNNNMQQFVFTSFKPLQRLLSAQLIAAVLILLALSLPLLLKLLILGNVTAFITLILGAILIVLFSAFLGIITKSKKLFEVMFFMVTYANINGVPFLDYFGGVSHTASYPLTLVLIIITLGISSFIFRKMEIERN